MHISSNRVHDGVRFLLSSSLAIRHTRIIPCRKSRRPGSLANVACSWRCPLNPQGTLAADHVMANRRRSLQSRPPFFSNRTMRSMRMSDALNSEAMLGKAPAYISIMRKNMHCEGASAQFHPLSILRGLQLVSEARSRAGQIAPLDASILRPLV